ncbi:MAG: 50S ribosomal protein L28 [Spirochaetes bacterium]|nr:50S ribosomal protein L28 [Spirochaetota bacterium]
MSRVCDICGKRRITGCNDPKSHKRTLREFLPNLHSIKVEINGEIKKIKICSKCLKANKVKKVL